MVSNLEYSMKDLRNLKDNYVGKVIKFDSKAFFFWKNRSNKVLKEIIVIFDNNYGNIEVLDGMVVVSLAGLKSEADLAQAFKIFSGILNNSSVKFTFLVANPDEKRIAEILGSSLRNVYEIKNGDEYINAKRVGMESSSVSNNLEFNDAKTVVKSDFGSNDIGVKSSIGTFERKVEPQEKPLLGQLATNPVMLENVSTFSKEELNKELNLNINNSVGNVKATSFKPTVINDSGERRLLSIGKDDLGSGEKKVITFPVKETVNEVKEVPEEKVDVSIPTTKFNYSYNDEVPVLGNNDSSLNMVNDNVYSKPKVKTLSKPSMSSYGEKRSGFVSFPVIIFVFSFILLVVSAVLLFVVD